MGENLASILQRHIVENEATKGELVPVTVCELMTGFILLVDTLQQNRVIIFAVNS